MRVDVNHNATLSDTAVADASRKIASLRKNLGMVIQGKETEIDFVTIALLAGGSILIEDVPGVGKTTLAKTIARSIDATFNRIQFTPDLLPADILGASIYNPRDGSFTFRKGPIFANVLLADEINRASPRTQSALLEAMSEMQATIEGVRHPLPAPFLVLATDNPVEFHGTYPLPEAQLDRFLMLVNLGYPDPDVEQNILHTHAEQHPLETLSPILSGDDILGLQQVVRAVRVEPILSRYIVELVTRSRQDERLRLGASPRGSLMLFRAAQASALSRERGYVLPDDVQRLAPHVLAHRVVLTSKAKYGGVQKADVIREILEQVRVPT